MYSGNNSVTSKRLRGLHFDLFKLVSKQISISGVRLRKPWCGGGIATSLVSLCKLRFNKEFLALRKAVTA